MPTFMIRRTLRAVPDAVWQVLDDFGNISRWNTGVKASAQTSTGEVAAGTTRHCDLSPFGAVDERIDVYEPGRRMAIDIYDTSRLPISNAVADFLLEPSGRGTELTIRYSYTLNRLGRVAKSVTKRQLEKGIGGLADDLVAACDTDSSA